MTQNNIVAAFVLGIAVVIGSYFLANKQITTINNLPSSGAIEVSAEGRVNVAPDMVQVNLTVQQRAQSSKEAYTKINVGVTELRKVLKDSGVLDTDIQTTSIYMSPEYNYDNGKQIPNGFSASHTMTIKVRKFESVNTILDGVVAIEGVQIQGVSYDLSDKEKVYSEARKMALEKARQKADELAKTSWVTLKKVHSISEGTSIPNYPLYQNVRAMDVANVGTSSSTTSVAPGMLEYSISVNVSYELN